MILNNFSFVEENIVLFFKNESRSEVCLLRVYDYDHQVLVSRRDIRIAADGKAAFPISYLTGDNFHDGVKYVLKEALQKPSLILRPENFCLLHKPNFCANDCSGYF